MKRHKHTQVRQLENKKLVKNAGRYPMVSEEEKEGRREGYPKVTNCSENFRCQNSGEPELQLPTEINR